MRFFSFVFLATLCCCRAASTSSPEQATLQKIVASEIGENAFVEKNNSSTFALAYQTKDRTVKFIVIRLADLQIVINERVQGSVTWEREMNIKVTKTPGIVKMKAPPEDNVRVIDLNNYIIHNK